MRIVKKVPLISMIFALLYKGVRTVCPRYARGSIPENFSSSNNKSTLIGPF